MPLLLGITVSAVCKGICRVPDGFVRSPVEGLLGPCMVKKWTLKEVTCQAQH